MSDMRIVFVVPNRTVMSIDYVSPLGRSRNFLPGNWFALNYSGSLMMGAVRRGRILFAFPAQRCRF